MDRADGEGGPGIRGMYAWAWRTALRGGCYISILIGFGGAAVFGLTAIYSAFHVVVWIVSWVLWVLALLPVAPVAPLPPVPEPEGW